VFVCGSGLLAACSLFAYGVPLAFVRAHCAQLVCDARVGRVCRLPVRCVACHMRRSALVDAI
jgi:hypothetical protein